MLLKHWVASTDVVHAVPLFSLATHWCDGLQ
jgi:hypothetical protein